MVLFLVFLTRVKSLERVLDASSIRLWWSSSLFSSRTIETSFTMMHAVVVTLLLCGAAEGMRLRLSMSLRKPLMAGNWKMNTDIKSAVALAEELSKSRNSFT